MPDENPVRFGESDLMYDLPGPPYHPADVMLAQFEQNYRMRDIREMDIGEWVRGLL